MVFSVFVFLPKKAIFDVPTVAKIMMPQDCNASKAVWLYGLFHINLTLFNGIDGWILKAKFSFLPLTTFHQKASQDEST
jgi:hypothetical protein